MSSQRTGPSQAAAAKPAKPRRGEEAASGRASKRALPKAASLKPPSSRATRAAERRQAIIEAALDEFVARGFSATRLDDVAKGARFPAIADFYYREVVSRGMAGMRALIELGIASGEIRQQGLTRFTQIVVAPAIVAVIWQGLFGRHSPLDATEMLRVHLDLIFGERRAT